MTLLDFTYDVLDELEIHFRVVLYLDQLSSDVKEVIERGYHSGADSFDVAETLIEDGWV